MRIVLDNQQNGVAGLQAQTIVRQLLGDALLRHGGHRRRRAILCRGADPRRDRRSGIFQRQIEREDTAFARGTLQMDFAAKQARKLTADSKAKARAAVFPAGAGIRLLEGFEDQLLLVLRNADAGIGYFKRDHRGRIVENGVFGAPAAKRRRDTQADAALGGELEGVGKQVFQHLLQSFRVGMDTPSEIGIDRNIEGELAVVGFVTERPADSFQEVGGKDVLGLHRHRARLDLGEI
jgi:hypothetical protein